MSLFRDAGNCGVDLSSSFQKAQHLTEQIAVYLLGFGMRIARVVNCRVYMFWLTRCNLGLPRS